MQPEEKIIAQALVIQQLRDVLILVRDDLEIRMQIAEDDSLNISNSVLDKMLDAIDSPDDSKSIIREHDDRVAEACALLALDRREFRASINTMDALDDVTEAIRSGEWRKYK